MSAGVTRCTRMLSPRAACRKHVLLLLQLTRSRMAFYFIPADSDFGHLQPSDPHMLPSVFFEYYSKPIHYFIIMRSQYIWLQTGDSPTVPDTPSPLSTKNSGAACSTAIDGAESTCSLHLCCPLPLHQSIFSYEYTLALLGVIGVLPVSF